MKLLNDLYMSCKRSKLKFAQFVDPALDPPRPRPRAPSLLCSLRICSSLHRTPPMTSPPESTSSKRTLVDSDSDSDCSAPALSVKRPRTDDDASSMLESKVASIFNKAVREPTSLNREELEDKSHEELVELVVLLQQRVRSAEKTATEPKRLSKEEVDAVVAVQVSKQRVARLVIDGSDMLRLMQRRVMVRGISAQMGVSLTIAGTSLHYLLFPS